MNNVIKFQRKTKTGVVIDGIYYDTTKWKKCDDCIHSRNINSEYNICLYDYNELGCDIKKSRINHCIHKEDCKNYSEKLKPFSFTLKLEKFLNHFNCEIIYNYHKKSVIDIFKESFLAVYKK